MDKNVIFNVIYLLVLIFGIISIINATIKPMKQDKKNSLIKDKQRYIKYNQKMYIVFGIMCIIVSILSLFKIIDMHIFGIGMGLIVAITAILNNAAIRKYTQHK